MLAAALLAAALLACGTARAQTSGGGGPLGFLDNLFTGSISKGSQTAPPGPRPGTSAQSQSAPATSSAAPPWSGEDGASGHPLMTAGAIREAAANFDNCVASIWPDAARRNITQANFERFTAGLAPDLRIMDLMDSQPEFSKSIWDYLDILVNDNRLAKGREILAKYKPQFDAVEKAYGVDRYAIAAIWGIADGRSQRSAIHRDPCLHRPPPAILPR
jgi:membrane-bound lytic murein transglycosylase B